MTKQPQVVPPTEHHLIHPKYRADIDGLRAVAVLSVVIFHAFPSWLKGGFVGVDIFFVISGFLISTILFTSLEKNQFSFSEFYARRVKRIFPALLLVLITSYVFGWYVLFADEFKQLGKHIAGGAGFISNFVLWDESGYFDTTAEVKPLLHLWSLGIEEQFYIVWPLILWATWKRKFNVLTITAAIFAASFAWNVNHVSHDPSTTFYLPGSRFWELLSGSIVAYLTIRRSSGLGWIVEKLDPILGKVIFSRQQDKGIALRDTQSMVGALLLVAGILCTTSKSAFPGWWAILPTAGAVLIISAGPRAWLNKTVLSSRLLVWIGLISFPLYLWHWPILSFARIVESQTPSLKIRVAAVIVAIALAWLTYRIIERPIRAGKSNYKTPVLVFLMILVGTAGYVTYKRDGLPFRPPIRSAEKINSQFVGPLWKYTKNETCVKRYPFHESDSYLWWFCIASSEQPTTVFVLGTSYANQLYPGFIQNSMLNKNSILSIGACDIAIDADAAAATPQTNVPCTGEGPRHQEQLIADIVEKNKSIKYIIIDGLTINNPDKFYIARLEKRIKAFEDHDIKVIIFTPHLRVDYDIKGCFARPLKEPQRDCIMPPEDVKKFKDAFAPIMASISKSHPNVAFFDQNQLFCDKEKCSMIRDGMPLFRDEYHHISEYGSIELSQIFVKWAEINAPGILIK
ncbi:acyltransferase family protein [Collimonas fungivorans]|nr:acyltransferase family protein [Collimonas fungivorans]